VATVDEKEERGQPTKNSVPPEHPPIRKTKSEVICWAGKNTSVIPRIVVRSPLAPAKNNVARPYCPPWKKPFCDREFHQRAEHIDERDQLQHYANDSNF